MAPRMTLTFNHKRSSPLCIPQPVEDDSFTLGYFYAGLERSGHRVLAAWPLDVENTDTNA